MTTRHKIIVTETLDETPAKWLAEHADVVWCRHDSPELDAHLKDAVGLVVRTYTLVTPEFLTRAPKLKVVGRAGVGLDNINLPACKARGVEVVYTPDANTQAVVEYVLGLVLDEFRPRHAMTEYVPGDEFHRLRKIHVGKQLDQFTLGILGFGRIGKRLGRVAAAIGMRVLVSDLLPETSLRDAVASAPGGAYPFEFVDTKTLCKNSDILSIHVDGRPENRGLINASTLALLKPSCVLINAARGMLIDTLALAAWAKSAATAGGVAIIDVHEPEPPPADYPLFGIKNVRLLPHLASRTPEALENMSWVVRDVLGVLDGKKPQFPA
jgi:D-3-phosphoglycerate dehydrogenase